MLSKMFIFVSCILVCFYAEATGTDAVLKSLISYFYRCNLHFDNVKIPFFLPTDAPLFEHIKC